MPDSLANANLTIVWDMTEEAWKAAKEEDPDAFNLVWTTKEEFEKKYGGKVEIIGVGWGDQASTVISMVNAGEVCDLAQAHDQNFPIYGAKNIVQDISQYIDLNDGFWYDSVTKAFKQADLKVEKFIIPPKAQETKVKLVNRIRSASQAQKQQSGN